MICEDLTNKIKNILGYRYSAQILDYLTEKNIYNNKGKPFSRGYISHIVNGSREDFRIEAAILELCDIKINHHKNMSIKKKRILSKNV